jgi:uncharacterized membrane protein
MLILSGIAVVVLGFALRFNPLLVVTLAGLVTGWAAGWAPADTIARLGHAFVANRSIAIAWLALPVIGLIERAGIRERTRALVLRLQGATVARVLTAYLLIRQVAAALGLTALGGHVQMVRPLIAPMAETAAERDGPLDEATRDAIRANAAAVDNIGVFFGEDIFVAIGSILVIKGFLDQAGIVVTPLSLAVWAIPTALMAFAVHATRLWLFGRRLARRSAP